MDKYLKMKKEFEDRADAKNATAMAKYMRNQFDFYGIAAPKRKEIVHDFINAEKKTKKIDWEFLDKCYKDEHREFQYLVYDYLLLMKKYVTLEDLPKIESYIVNKSWWDTIDFLCKVIGDLELREPSIKDYMIAWSTCDNIWKRRAAIEHQLGLKEKTDPALLEQIIINCLGTDEFFINKAIGWALREYSKTNPGWVKNFLSAYKSQISSLSKEEANKYLS